MSDPKMIKGIQEAVSIPVMAKCRIGHFAEAQILEAIEIDYIDESEVLSPADDVYHIDKTKFKVPFVCGAKDLGEALRRINEGASMIRTKGEPGTGDVVQAVRHMRKMNQEIARLTSMREDELFQAAKELQVPYELVAYVHENGKLPVVNFAAGGVATPADAALMMQLGAEGVFVGSGIFKSGDPKKRAAAIVKAVTNFNDAKMLAEQGKGAEEIKEILEKENIFVMDESRASHQDIRPIQILILNLMPLKEETELQLLRSLSNTPLQVDVTFMAVQSHEAKNTSVSHLNKFYQTFPELKNNKYDGMIITGAPVEQMEFEEVDYWKELVKIMDWTNTHVTSTIYLCWAAQAGLYHHYGLKKRKLDKKMFGLFWHKVMNRKIPLVRGFDDMFLAPHSRHTEVPIEDIHNCKELTVLAESDEAGLFLAMADGGRKIFVMGHPEYDRVTLDGEYKRDVSKNLPIEIPENYYKDNNPENRPLLMWRAHANNLYTNWLNYYVYQSTPFDLYGTPDFEHI